MTNLIGQSIGRYHILEQLGEGGMATVYKAFDTRLERDVAIKVIRREAFPPNQLERILKRFEREAKSLARLSHPNILKVHDYGEHEGAPYLVLEYLPGGTLKQRLGQPMPWQEALTLMLPVVDALAYAHEHRIIHRDIKPSNILLSEKGQPLLTDFGIAKILDLEEGQTLTGTGVGIGTPEYMAPEQGMGKDVDARADIYSLGIVLYELVTGRKPYTADTPMAVVFKHMTDPLPHPRQFIPDLPDGVEKLLLKALAKQPEDRYPDMESLAAAMRALLNTGAALAQVSQPTPSETTTRSDLAQANLNDAPTRDETPLLPHKTRPPAAAALPRSIPRPWWQNLWLWAGAGLLTLTVIFGIFSNQPPTTTANPPPTNTVTPTSSQMPQDTPAINVSPKEPAIHLKNGKLVIWADDTRGPILQRLAPQFLKSYNLELEVVIKASLGDDFQVAAPVGEGPDIIVIPHDQAGTLVTKSLLAEVDLGDKVDLFSEVAKGACTFDSVLYCMPYATENLGFIYNTTLVKAPPATWDEVIKIGEALKAEGKITYVMAIAGTTYDLYPLYTSFGGYIFGRFDNGDWNDQDLGLDSPGMIAATTFLRENVENGNFPSDWDWSVNHALFVNGEAAFIMAGPWALEWIRDSGVPYAVANAFPAGPAGAGAPFAGTQGFFISSQSEKILLAQDFLSEFIATEEVMMELFEVGQRPSAFLPVLEKTDDPDLLAMGLAGSNAVMMPAIPAMSAVWGNWDEAISLVRNGTQDAETALKESAARIRDLIATP